MAKVTPASIRYEVDGIEQVLDFHAVISEGHEVAAQVTKYPVQSGLHISNHSIRQNRVVKLEGVITNTRLNSVATITQSGLNKDYGEDATSTVKESITALIQNGIECEVITNLGVYSPVVFNKFSTKQAEGLVDSMRLILAGEEIVKETDEHNFTAPEILAFSPVPNTDRARVEELFVEAGLLEVPEEPEDIDTEVAYRRPIKFSKATFIDGKDFIINNTNSAGTGVTTTYEYVGDPPPTGKSVYKVHLSESAVALAGAEEDNLQRNVCREKNFDKTLEGGVKTAGACFADEAVNQLDRYAEDTVKTAIGEATKSAYGIFYEVTDLDDKYGSALLAAGIGCFIRGITEGIEGDPTYKPSESLPSVEEIMEGARKGIGYQPKRLRRSYIYKMTCDYSNNEYVDVDTASVPIG